MRGIPEKTKKQETVNSFKANIKNRGHSKFNGGCVKDTLIELTSYDNF